MLKKSRSQPPGPGASRRAFSHALFSHRSETRRTARVRLVSSLAAAVPDGLFEHPAGSSTITMNVSSAKPHRAEIVYLLPVSHFRIKARSSVSVVIIPSMRASNNFPKIVLYCGPCSNPMA